MTPTFELVEMQISTLIRRFILISLRHLFPRELSFTFCVFGTVAFLIILSTVVIHRMLMLISRLTYSA